MDSGVMVLSYFAFMFGLSLLVTIICLWPKGEKFEREMYERTKKELKRLTEKPRPDGEK